MANNKVLWDRAFIGFGIVTIICGILLVLQKDYIAGVGGTIVGIWLVATNWYAIKGESRKGS